jgi:hypothetical protein
MNADKTKPEFVVFIGVYLRSSAAGFVFALAALMFLA